MSSRFLLLAAALAACAVPAAFAAGVSATVSDKAGRPLEGAVLMLEPEGARLPVKPVTGIEISQTKKRFTPDVSIVTVGTAVTFPNRDTVRHHVYSFSAAKPFELKLYAGTPSAPVVFDKPGVVVIGCNIHDQMTAWVVIVDTPFHGRTGADGQLRLDGVPAGSYKLRAWHPGLAEGAAPVALALRVGTADLEQALSLDVAAAQP